MRKSLPNSGSDWEQIRSSLSDAKKNDVDWRNGRLSGLVYYAADDVLQIAKDAYEMYFTENAVGREPFPSLVQLESEVIDMTASLLNGGDSATGCMTSGGTESIFLAIKSARDWARVNKPTNGTPEIVAARSAHHAFNKAAHYLGLKVTRIPLRSDFRADPTAMESAITDDTIMLVGSAPAYPHGVIDPIGELGEVAERRGLWLHVDACVGGFLAPFVKRLGYPIPDFDFSVPGVTSMSADLHKHGYTAKGASTIMQRNADYFDYQGFEFNEWPRGRHQSRTIVGTRSGGAVAAAWAVMNYLGEEGYMRLTQGVMQAKRNLMEGINEIDDLETYGDPDLGIFTYGSPTVDISAVADGLADVGWYPNRLTEPPGIQMLLFPTHLPVVEEYLSDVSYIVDRVKSGDIVGRGTEATY